MLRPLIALILSIPALACAAPKSPQGVWSGTLGTKAIVACFNEVSRWTSYASYYYVDHSKPITLTSGDRDAFWHESDDDTGLWDLSAPANGVIVGTWSHPKTRKTLPIKLGYVDGSDDKTACARDSYNARLEVTPKVEAARSVQFSPGRSYRKMRFAGQETVELVGPDSALRQINSALKLDQSREVVQSYFQQRREFLGRVGSPAVDERLAEPTYWDANFITVQFYLSVAGEGRSGIFNAYRTWNVRTGEEIDLWQWIGASTTDKRLPPKLKKFLYRNIKVSPECADGYLGQGEFTLTLSKNGLNISEESWGDGCDQSFFVPYEKLAPFLSPTGIQAVNSIRGRK